MGDAPPDFRRGEILRAGELLRRGNVPQPEIGLQPAVALARDAAGDQRLRVDDAPIGKARQHVDVGDPLDIGAGSIGANSPERLRFAAITCVTLRPTSPSPDDSPTKSGSAIGIGWMLPVVTSMLTAAPAARGSNPVAAVAAPPASNVRRVIQSLPASHPFRPVQTVSVHPRILNVSRRPSRAARK